FLAFGPDVRAKASCQDRNASTKTQGSIHKLACNQASETSQKLSATPLFRRERGPKAGHRDAGPAPGSRRFRWPAAAEGPQLFPRFPECLRLPTPAVIQPPSKRGQTSLRSRMLKGFRNLWLSSEDCCPNRRLEHFRKADPEEIAADRR